MNKIVRSNKSRKYNLPKRKKIRLLRTPRFHRDANFTRDICISGYNPFEIPEEFLECENNVNCLSPTAQTIAEANQ